MAKENLAQFTKSLQDFNSQLPILKSLISALYARSNNLQNKLKQLDTILKKSAHIETAFSDSEDQNSTPSFDSTESIQYLHELFDELGPKSLEHYLCKLNISSLEELSQEKILSTIKDVEKALYHRYDYENRIALDVDEDENEDNSDH